MSKPTKIFFWTVGLIIGFMVIGMLLSAVFRIKPDEIRAMNIIAEFQWYRMGFYVLIIALWPWLCKFMTRPRMDLKKLTEHEVKAAQEKQQRDYLLLKSKHTHVIILILFFEIVVIRQFGL